MSSDESHYTVSYIVNFNTKDGKKLLPEIAKFKEETQCKSFAEAVRRLCSIALSTRKTVIKYENKELFENKL